MSSQSTGYDVSAEPAFGLRLVAHNLLIDQLTAEVTSALEREQIDTLVLKGPALAKWLYPGEIRIYSDADLLIARRDKTSAVAVLGRLGFTVGYRSRIVDWLPGDLDGVEYHRGCGAVERFRQRSSAEYAARMRVRCETIDLHCAIAGLFGDPDAIWHELCASSEQLRVGGVTVSVPNRAFILLHVCLHAAQHVGDTSSKAFEDLRRAIATTEEADWWPVLALAQTFEGTAAFAAGLQCIADGDDLACRLGLPKSPSLRFMLWRDDAAVDRRLAAIRPRNVGFAAALVRLGREVAPPPAHMRTWWPQIARRGAGGLLCAYVWRLVWAARKVGSRVFEKRVARSIDE